MRIGFDFRPALKTNSRNRGIGRYTHELAKALLEVNTRHEFLLYTLAGECPALSGSFESREIASLTYPSRLNWLLDLALLPRYIGQDDLQLFHCTELTGVHRTGTTRTWVTVHDLIPLIFWEETVKQIPRDFAFFLRLAWKRIRQADKVITDSEHSKNDICERMDIPGEKVEVVYLGTCSAIRHFDRGMALEALRHLYGMEEPFLFYVGGSDYRKNMGLLVRAFATIRERGFSGKLVIAGETFGMDIPEVREIRRQIHSLGLEPWVVLPGYVSDEDLSLFYSACEFFVFPSLYEGFGLPVLEAMKCGAPLLVSDTSSVPEVAGDCAHYFDPSELDSLLEAFWKAYENPARVELLRVKGMERATRFSWRGSAEKIHRLYSEL